MFVYADNAATTKMSKTAIDAMLPYLDTWYGNASSLYAFGQKSAEALAAARETVAGCLGAEARRRAKSTSFPRRLSITRCCIRSRS